MDGYAINFNQNNSLSFDVVGSILAGSLKVYEIKPGEAIEIMTGGKIPKGTNAVVPIELTEISNNTILLKEQPKSQANIRKIGEDIHIGQIILQSGKYLRPAEIGLLASLGINKVSVFKKITAVYFSTGDEIIAVGKSLKSGQVYDSNHYSIGAMLQSLNIKKIDFRNVPDDKEKIKKELLKASKIADVIISSGGVSVGKADFMKEILSEIGEILFWKLAIKPGRPLAYGKIKKAHYFGLPGNPVSAMVTFYQMVQPAIKKLMGNTNFSPPPTFEVKCTKKIFKKPGRMEFQRGILSKVNNKWVVEPTRSQGSGVLSSMSEANCFIVLLSEQGLVEKGDMVFVQYMEGVVS
jgi:molybdopterin molybdotransferase